MFESAHAVGKRNDESLAQLFDITSRTVRNDIKAILDTLSKHGASIITQRGKGYQLQVDNAPLFHSFLQEIAFAAKGVKALPSEPKERIIYIIKRLLLSEHYLKLEELAEELYVSLPTVKNDLKSVRQILHQYELQLEKRPNYGLKISGNEMKWRYCIAEYVFHDSPKPPRLLSEKEMAIIRSIIIDRSKAAGIRLSEMGLNNLVTHIAIAFRRILSEKYIAMDERDLSHLANQREHRVAKQIVKDIESAFHVSFPDAEVGYVTIHLLGTKMTAYTKRDETDLSHLIDPDLYALTQACLAEVERHFDLGLQDDQELILGLSLHLKPA